MTMIKDLNDETSRTTFEAIPDGQITIWRLDGGATYLRIWKAADGYHIDYSARVNEKYDEDPGSINCGCPLQSRSHGHAHAVYDTIDAAAKALTVAAGDVMYRRAPTFAQFKRIG